MEEESLFSGTMLNYTLATLLFFCLTADNFTCQARKSTGAQWVNQTICPLVNCGAMSDSMGLLPIKQVTFF